MLFCMKCHSIYFVSYNAPDKSRVVRDFIFDFKILLPNQIKIKFHFCSFYFLPLISMYFNVRLFVVVEYPRLILVVTICDTLMRIIPGSFSHNAWRKSVSAMCCFLKQTALLPYLCASCNGLKQQKKTRCYVCTLVLTLAMCSLEIFKIVPNFCNSVMILNREL